MSSHPNYIRTEEQLIEYLYDLMYSDKYYILMIAVFETPTSFMDKLRELEEIYFTPGTERNNAMTSLITNDGINYISMEKAFITREQIEDHFKIKLNPDQILFCPIFTTSSQNTKDIVKSLIVALDDVTTARNTKV